MHSLFLVTLVISTLLSLVFSSAVLSNTALPIDTDGVLMFTGETSVLKADNGYYFFVNVWGGCPGVDCCPTANGCASCCFQGVNDPCVYTDNHTVISYFTKDFSSWENKGTALAISNRRIGIEFRPQVIYSKALGQYVMWYEDRWANGTNSGYAVATSTNAYGPYTTISDSTKLGGKGRIGDYDIFVDPDTNIGYHVRTGITIVQLDENMTAPANPPAIYELPNSGVEGPAMFKRNGTYYMLVGVGCCACRGGSNVIVYTSTNPLGPYILRGDVGSNSSQPFDKHSPTNYETHAQQTKVFIVTAPDGTDQYVWVGNQWVSSDLPGNPRDHDLLFWTVLDFDDTGMIKQINWSDDCIIDV